MATYMGTWAVYSCHRIRVAIRHGAVMMIFAMVLSPSNADHTTAEMPSDIVSFKSLHIRAADYQIENHDCAD